MIETGKDIERLLARILKPEGFRKKGRTWRLDAPETITVVNLQKSRWTEAYFVNLGVMPKSIQSIAEPGAHQCQFHGRLAKLVPDRLACHALFDLYDSTYSAAEREKGILAAMRDYGLPLLRRCRTFDGMLAAIAEDPQLGYFTSYDLRRIVGQPTVEPRSVTQLRKRGDG